MSSLSASPAGTADARSRARDGADAQPRPLIRLITFSALTLYGIERWAGLFQAPPSWRLLGLGALAIALAGGVCELRRLALPDRAARAVQVLVAVCLVLASLPVAGLRWHLVWHLKIAVAAREIGHGLGQLGAVLVPYDGFDHRVTLVITLGVAVLALDAAMVLAFAPGGRASDARRMTAALPLIALAIVPSTLVAPADPYLQGLLLFALVALFVWGERLAAQGARVALAMLLAAGLAGIAVAPLVDSGVPWVNYQSWSGVTSTARLASFAWNQSYGPLRWPQKGNEVLTVKAKTGEYWTAARLSDFDGREWVQRQPTVLPSLQRGPIRGSVAVAPLPSPSASALREFTERIRVTVQEMRTRDLIGADDTTLVSELHRYPAHVSGAVVVNPPLGPGASYVADIYAPTPSASDLIAASGQRYPWSRLRGFLTLSLPTRAGRMSALPVQFSRFGAPSAHVDIDGRVGGAGAATVEHSPYGRAYELAQKLAAESHSEYQLVRLVLGQLSTSNGFVYDQTPPPARYPLEAFLFGNHRGYCQQFSGAMALLLRMAGVPVRVATGFTKGSYDTHNHSWHVSDIDAHAWDEVWFPQYGWVRFDPTPAAAPARGGSGAATSTPVDPRQVANAPTEGNRAGVGATPRGVSTPAAAVDHAHARHAGPSDWLLAAAAAALAALLGLVAVGWVLTRPAGSTEQLIAELERALARTGRPLSDGVTLAALEDRYRSMPQVAGYLQALRLARYGGRPVTPSHDQRRALRRELHLGLGPLGRLRALRAMPPRLRTGTR